MLHKLKRPNQFPDPMVKSASLSHKRERAPYYSTNRWTGFGAESLSPTAVIGIMRKPFHSVPGVQIHFPIGVFLAK